MNLPLLSASFLAFALTLYALLDGFDLGVGILLLFQPEAAFRDHMVDSITPTWDGNETWIIMAGVTLLAAFPIAYSILLPAFYLPVIVMLLALGFRGVSFEFRVQSINSGPINRGASLIVPGLSKALLASINFADGLHSDPSGSTFTQSAGQQSCRPKFHVGMVAQKSNGHFYGHSELSY